MADKKPNDAVILSACRTAIGAYQGGLSPLTATQMGALVVREAVSRSGVDSQTIDEVIMGQVVQAGSGQAPARQAAIHGGIPSGVPCMTINKVCGSGLKAVMLAAQSIRAGDQNLIVAGGMESMSNTPFVLHGAKKGLRFGDQTLKDTMVLDGLWDSFNDFHMGSAAELTARKSNISRGEPSKPRSCRSPLRSAKETPSSSRRMSARDRIRQWHRWQSCVPRSKRTAPSPPGMRPVSMTAPAP
jgi:acetyl-CoA C-acetyltransferase